MDKVTVEYEEMPVDNDVPAVSNQQTEIEAPELVVVKVEPHWGQIEVEDNFYENDVIGYEPITSDNPENVADVIVKIEEPQLPEWDAFQQQNYGPSTSHPLIVFPVSDGRKTKHQALDGKTDDLFPCNVCCKIFMTENLLSEHIKTHTDPHICHLCKKQYSSAISLKKHLATVHNKVPHICPTCGNVFTQKRNLIAHMKIHTNQRNMFKCTFCEKSWVKKESFDRHIRTKHNGQEFCTQCRQYFKNIDELNIHKFVHLGEVFRCEHCTNVYQNKDSVRVHMVSHFSPHRLQCTLCPRTLSCSSNLRQHMLYYHGVGGGNYKCDVCKKNFKTRQLIEDHIKMHLRSHMCYVCHEIFGHKCHLSVHVKTVHGPLFTPKYHCDACTCISTSRNSMVRHYLKFHNPEYMYKCVRCNCTFPTEHGLAGHKCKGKEKKYTCTICQRVFSLLGGLTRHQKKLHC